MEEEDFEQAQTFFERMSSEDKSSVLKQDSVLRFFDQFSVLEVLEGKAFKFDVEKIAEMQDRVDKLDRDGSGEDECVREIFAPGATKNLNVRSHKLIKLIKDRLTELSQSPQRLNTLTSSSSSTPNPAVDSPPRQQPAPQKQSDTLTNEEARMRPQYMRLAPDLPEGARINIRKEPNSDAEVVSTLDDSGVVLAVGRAGDWAKVRSDEFGEAWVLTCIPDRTLLVECAPPVQQQASRMDEMEMNSQNENMASSNVQRMESTAALSKTVSATTSMSYAPMQNPYAPPRTPTFSATMAPRYGMEPQLTPPPPNADPKGFVTLEEHNRLRYKVAQLEADMRALRLLLRSWSLDTPAHGY